MSGDYSLWVIALQSQNLLLNKLGVVVLWHHLVVRTMYCLLPVAESNILGGGWCFPFHVKPVSYGRLLCLCV